MHTETHKQTDEQTNGDIYRQIDRDREESLTDRERCTQWNFYEKYFKLTKQEFGIRKRSTTAR